ncbi:hypothetical protein PIB30_050367 [Stylosanthes scabra]|uniref:Uncharacterized protein n=1 Tax=Stylosanthes scabra TaxID=79078 RepID=A0ABU6QI44_9FABA|nr:hypothetical protein [Stylosanthes scabra]
MGSSYSTHHTNLGKESTLFDSSATSTVARWGGAFTLSMGNWKENNDHTEVWGVEYKTKQNPNTMKLVCGFQLKVNRDNTGVDSIHLGIKDSSSENETKFSVKITRVARDGLSGGITDIDSSSGGAPVLFTRVEESCTIETNVVSYHCTNREGLFVLETKKKRATGVPKNSSLMLKPTTPIESNHEEQKGKDEVVSQVVKQAMLSSNVEVQYNKGLINSTGNISGFLNNCIIFMNYKLPNLE